VYPTLAKIMEYVRLMEMDLLVDVEKTGAGHSVIKGQDFPLMAVKNV